MRVSDWKSFIFLLVIIQILICPIQVFAAEREDEEDGTEAVVHFGSYSYERMVGAEFNIGMYMNSPVALNSYSITMSYDPEKLEYVSGADSGGNGKVTLRGSSETGFVKGLITFRALSAGNMTIRISEASARDTSGRALTIVNQGTASMTIRSNGQDEEESVQGEPVIEEPVVEEPVIEELAVEEAEQNEALTEEPVQEEAITEEPVQDAQIPEEPAQPEQPGQGETAVPSQDQGNGSKGLIFSILKQKIIYVPLLIVVVSVLVISTITTYVEYSREIEFERRRKRAEQRRKAKNEYESDYDESEPFVPFSDPVIVVDDVCMEFKIATQNVSGIKEWMIESIKGKISYRVLHALDHITFNVYPGEVIGIIGTNGSGKSTLLKIISGALKPTSGTVHVDRRKIQILTLGTGFDMELTARENVYLNGSIIGYSREFIDEHYDEIVEFAELSDFMEEKVKNFSSGMVSRLGFAIATAGDAAEILILDEVLSVGDEFFRKKSLARIKEMIHGGSTVLLVSHGMGTIRDNCSRAIWIEKGTLRMAGDVEEVCKAYQSMG